MYYRGAKFKVPYMYIYVRMTREINVDEARMYTRTEAHGGLFSVVSAVVIV